jgi:S1-C subfamily serine protease
MRLAAARRPRLVAAILVALTGGCTDDGPVARPTVVRVAAQPCDRPNRSHGLRFVVADGLVATAAHTVEGPHRDLTVDGVPATVAALDPRTDLALLAVDLAAPPAALSLGAATAAIVLHPDGATPLEIVRSGTLVVHDTTDRARFERQVHTFEPGIAEGTSGAPLVDPAGRVLGVVVLDRPGRGSPTRRWPRSSTPCSIGVAEDRPRAGVTVSSIWVGVVPAAGTTPM